MPAQTVLITGSSSGIGRATAELLAEKGYRVIASMRSPEKGRELAQLAASKGWELKILPLDVCDDASVQAAVGEAGQIDVLVNNAGMEVWGALEEMQLGDLIDQLDTNLYGPFRCMNAVLPQMRQRGRGVIVNVSSVAGRVAAPLNGAYAASKFALEALSEALHYELGHFGVRVHLIEPGGIDTPFPEKRRLLGATAGDESSPYRELVTQWEAASTRILPGGQRSPARAVAEAILEAIEKGDKLRYPVGPDAQTVLMVRKQMDDETFESTMRQQLGLTW